MAYFLFIDESGQDRINSPYEVLTGVAIEDRDLWNLIQAIQECEIRHFGMRYSKGHNELKGKKLLKRKIFRHALLHSPIQPEERRILAKACLEQAATAHPKEWAALAQAKLDYVKELFDICSRFRCRVFASIVNSDEPYEAHPDYLRKDYVYLFERFYYFLEDVNTSAMGIVVFDELEKSKSHILVAQMERYFKQTAKGRQRSGRIMPEPFFVHSDLTTGIQIADLVAYILSWGFRTGDLAKPAREELSDYVQSICQLRYRAVREVNDNPEFVIWSIGVIRDLRARAEQTET